MPLHLFQTKAIPSLSPLFFDNITKEKKRKRKALPILCFTLLDHLHPNTSYLKHLFYFEVT
jgi:hypothetical protein